MKDRGDVTGQIWFHTYISHEKEFKYLHRDNAARILSFYMGSSKFQLDTSRFLIWKFLQNQLGVLLHHFLSMRMKLKFNFNLAVTDVITSYLLAHVKKELG